MNAPQPIHFPKNPEKFEFDAEVAPLFQNMASRSIPQYNEMVRLHAELVVDHFLYKNAKVLDVGASRGEFFKQILDVYAGYGEGMHTGMRWTAVDNSAAMCRLMEQELPNVDVQCLDIDSNAFMALQDGSYAVVHAYYILQFISPERQVEVLRKLAKLVEPGGILILGQKDSGGGYLGRLMQDKYIDWRMGNGYSREEIVAKTEALKGSMWPMSRHGLMANLLGMDFREVMETSRFTLFSSILCYK